MKIFHVVAMSRNRVIGKDNKLPWHFPEDLKFFKSLTTGHAVLMGRKTYQSIGRPLPNRTNYVLSRSTHSDLLKGGQAIIVVQSLDDLIKDYFQRNEKVYIIGGAEIYKQTIDKVDGIYLTRIDADYEGDAFYPEIPDDFEEIEVTGLREKDPKIEVIFYERKK